MNNSISNFSNNRIISSLVGKYNIHNSFSMPNFRGRLEKDCFQKQEYSFENIPQSAISLADNLKGEDKTIYLEILNEISKSTKLKNSYNGTVDSFFFQDLKENIFGSEYDSEKLNEYYNNLSKKNKSELVKNLLSIKDFPNQDIAYTISSNFLSKEDVQAKTSMAKYLVSNTNIPNNDYSLILSKTESAKNCELQKQAINTFLENNDYDGDFIPYLIENIKNENDMTAKLMVYDSFKILPYEIKSIFMNEVKGKAATDTAKAIEFICKHDPSELVEDNIIDLKTNVQMLCDFVEFDGCTDKNHLTKDQKEKFLKKLVTSSITLNDFHYKDDFSILPNDDEDYISTIRSLQKDINVKNSSDIDFYDMKIDYTKYSTLFNRLNDDANYTILDEKSKKIVDIAAMISSQDNPSQKLNELLKNNNIQDADYKKIFSLVKFRDFLAQDIEKYGLYFAFSLRDDDTFKLTSILSKAVTNIDQNKAQQKTDAINKIRDELEKTDFILPQTSKEDILAVSKPQQIGDKTILVASYKDIKDFSAFIHAIDTNLFSNCDNPDKKLDNVVTFDNPNSEEIICCSYINSDKIGIAGDTGAIIDATPYNTLLANGYDLHSPRFPNLKEASLDYFKTEDTTKHREFISEEIKKYYTGTADDYKKEIKTIIKKSNNRNLNNSTLETLSPKYSDATKQFLNTENEDYEKTFMKDSGTFNEVLIKQPKIKALYTTSIDLLSDTQLDFAQNNNLPVVLLS